MSADNSWTRWDEFDGQTPLAPPSPLVETHSRSHDMPSPSKPDRPKIRDPFTGLPYQPVDWFVLDMMTRGKAFWCFYSIPGTLYFLSRTMTHAPPHNNSLRFKLDCRHNDLANRTGKLEEQEMHSYTRLYMRWLMTETPHSSLATVNPDGSVLLTPKAQASIYVLRQTVAQTKNVAQIMATFTRVFKDPSKPPAWDWAHVMKTEPVDYLPYMWSGVLPEPERYLYSSSLPARQPQSERQLMKEAYTPAAHEAARLQDRLAENPVVAGQSVLWTPREDSRNFASWARVNDLVLFSRHKGVDPFLLEMDGRSKRDFTVSLSGDVSLSGAPLEGDPYSSKRRRYEYWLQVRAKSDFYLSLPNVDFENHEQQENKATSSTAGRSKRTKPHNTTKRPSRVVKLKIRPALLAQKLAQITRQGNHSSGTTGTMLARSRMRLGALHDALIANSTNSINGVPHDTASMTVAAFTPHKHQYPPEELEHRHGEVIETAQEEAFKTLDWELATSRSELSRHDNHLLAEQRSGTLLE